MQPFLIHRVIIPGSAERVIYPNYFLNPAGQIVNSLLPGLEQSDEFWFISLHHLFLCEQMFLKNY
jgi:hypothetical protein